MVALEQAGFVARAEVRMPLAAPALFHVTEAGFLALRKAGRVPPAERELWGKEAHV